VDIINRVLSFFGKSVIPIAAAIFMGTGVTPAPTPVVLSQSEIMHIFTTPSPTLTPTLTPTPRPTSTPKPTQTPSPTPIPVSAGQLDGWFSNYANYYGIDRQKFWLTAVCESKLRVNAVNRDYAGLFQFSANTWRSVRSRMGLDPDPSLRFNPEESIRTAAYKIARDGYAAWPNCGK